MGRILIMAASILHILAYLYAAPEHAMDNTWNDHSRFHIVQAIFWVIGLDLISFCIAFFKPFNMQPQIKWTLIIIFLTAHGGYFLSMLIVPEGSPPDISSHLALFLILLIYLVGLIMIFKNQKKA